MATSSAEIYELQLYLRTIQLARGLRPLINPDGIYGAETKEAVRNFQRANNLPATGEVDTPTWNRIYEEYLIAEEILGIPQEIRAFPINIGELKRGDEMDEIYVLQFLLRKNDKRLNNGGRVEFSGIFDDETERSVMEFQRIFGEAQTGVVDKFLWNKLSKYHNVKYLNE
ncbi:MAG: peptidoglycan-binding protein [Clostridia bacterium]|nr:peptidoglycan-binding protein [Clostridia bacterium]